MEWLPELLRYNNTFISDSLLAIIDGLSETGMT